MLEGARACCLMCIQAGACSPACRLGHEGSATNVAVARGQRNLHSLHRAAAYVWLWNDISCRGPLERSAADAPQPKAPKGWVGVGAWPMVLLLVCISPARGVRVHGVATCRQGRDLFQAGARGLQEGPRGHQGGVLLACWHGTASVSMTATPQQAQPQNSMSGHGGGTRLIALGWECSAQRGPAPPPHATSHHGIMACACLPRLCSPLLAGSPHRQGAC